MSQYKFEKIYQQNARIDSRQKIPNGMGTSENTFSYYNQSEYSI